MPLFTFYKSSRVRQQTEKRLSHYAQPSVSYFLLISLSSAIATIGLVLNNTAIVIGAMVVAPLITPIFGLSLSLIVFEYKRVLRSANMLLLGTCTAIAVAILMAMIITFVEGQAIPLTDEIISRTTPHLLLFLTALFSGMAGAYAYAKKEVLASIAGIAISVAVIPPLATTGIGVVLQSSFVVSASFLLFLLNLFGIAFGSIIMFIALGFAKTS